jgi:hypothetical protein
MSDNEIISHETANFIMRVFFLCVGAGAGYVAGDLFVPSYIVPTIGIVGYIVIMSSWVIIGIIAGMHFGMLVCE